MQLQRLVFVLVLSVWVVGCVFNQSFHFNYVPPKDAPKVGQGTTVVLLPVADERPYIVNKVESVDYVGVVRNGYNQPYGVTTSDKRPFAQVVQEAVQRDLESAGYTVVRASRPQFSNEGLKVTVHDFRSDMDENNIKVSYDIMVQIFDPSGKVRAATKELGTKELPSSRINSVGAAKKHVPEFFNTLIHSRITGDADIVKALNSR